MQNLNQWLLRQVDISNQEDLASPPMRKDDVAVEAHIGKQDVVKKEHRVEDMQAVSAETNEAQSPLALLVDAKDSVAAPKSSVTESLSCGFEAEWRVVNEEA